MVLLRIGFLSVVGNCCLGMWLVCSVENKKLFDGTFFGCDQESLRETDFFETVRNTNIAVLKDRTGEKFVIKQNVKSNQYQHLSVAREKLGVFIAHSVGVPANRVEIIPAGYEFPGKRVVDLPATLHNFVPGKIVSTLPRKEKRLIGSIKQSTKKHLSLSQRGFTRKTIRNMAAHAELPVLVAMDTFIANSDRGGKNCFYEKEANRVHAIDFGNTFKKNIAYYACNTIGSILDNKDELLEEKEIFALKRYNDTLKELMSYYLPEDMYTLLVQFVEEGGINIVSPSLSKSEKNSALRSLWSDIVQDLKIFKAKIHENYAACKKLVILIDKLLIKYDYKKGRKV